MSVSDLKSDKYNVSLNLVCPNCESTGTVDVNLSKIKVISGFLKTCIIEIGTICEHCFIIFIDNNNIVRSEYKVDATIGVKENQYFFLFKNIFSEEIFYKIFRTCFFKKPIYCISDIDIINKSFFPFMNKIFSDLTFYIKSKLDYQKNREDFLNDLEEGSFVFNADIKTIIKQPYKNKFKKDDYGLERIILDSIPESINDDIIIPSLQINVEMILNKTNILKEEIKEKKIKNNKVLKIRIKELFENVQKIENDQINQILKYRYDFDINKEFLKTDVRKLLF